MQKERLMAENKEIPWEKELIEKYMFTLHKEQVKDRRWRTMLRVLRASGFVLLMIGFIILASNPGGMPWQSAKAGAPHTAYINIRGEIAAGTLADADHLIPSIQAAFDNPNSQAVVLRINSPGGYYIASAADEIYADRASLVGSIGVISSGFGFTGLMDRLGIERRAITSGEHKALLDPFSPLTSDMKKFWEGVLSKTHQQFIERVKAGRGDRLKDAPEVFSGLLWNGEQAKEIGLIDGLGSLNSVARDVIHQSNLVDYTPTEDIIRRLTQRAKLEASSFVQELSAVKVY
ncbi:S49 family peptidase [Salmonella enterica subsp. enterica serovar Typhimurium]|nr:S49 family peptidase [Salmonella enterica subsp. enterica serovar Typhimurium]